MGPNRKHPTPSIRPFILSTMLIPNSEIVSTTRDLIAVLVPQGDKVHIPVGTEVAITQALGGSFTIYIQGRLFRVDGADADALGKPIVAGPTLPPNAKDEDVEKLVWDQLKTCFDPEIPVDIVELGLVYECRLEKQAEQQRTAKIKMTLTAPGCGMGETIVSDVRSKVSKVPTVQAAEIELVFDPPWNQSMMSEAARLQLGML